MAKTWTAERDQKLLLLLLDQINVTGGIAAAAAKAWKTNYVDTNKDTYQPTARAVTEHLNQLKASVYGKGSGGTPKAKVTPKSTPRKAPATKTKTPTRGTKRKRGKMSDEDDDDDDDDIGEEEDNTDAKREMLETTPSNSRSSLPRRSKIAKSYQQDDDSSDDDEIEDNDVIDGEYDVVADLDKFKATRSKSRPSPTRPSKSAAKAGHEDEDSGGDDDDGHLEDAEIAVPAGPNRVKEQVEAESHYQNDEGSDEDEDANLPKVTMAAPMAQEEGVNFFAAKDSAETDRLVQTQRVTKERSLNASSGGIDLFWIWAPLMSYRPDIWSGLVLALVWITQMLVVPFELMIIAALIWDVQGEGNPVPAGYFVYLTCILTCIVLTALEIAFWMVDALHPYTFLGFQVFKAGFWLVFFPIGIATTVMMRVIASGLLWDFWWIFQTVFLSLGFTATIAALIYGAWVAHTYKD